MTSRGNFFGLRTNTNGKPKAKATGAPKIKPRDSVPTILVIPLSLNSATIASILALKASGTSSNEVISRKIMPAFG